MKPHPINFFMGILLGAALTYVGIQIYYHNFNRCDCSGWERNYKECHEQLGECRLDALVCIDCAHVLEARIELILLANRFYYRSWVDFARKYEDCQYGDNP